jgi:hypothetical protein
MDTCIEKYPSLDDACRNPLQHPFLSSDACTLADSTIDGETALPMLLFFLGTVSISMFIILCWSPPKLLSDTNNEDKEDDDDPLTWLGFDDVRDEEDDEGSDSSNGNCTSVDDSAAEAEPVSKTDSGIDKEEEERKQQSDSGSAASMSPTTTTAIPAAVYEFIAPSTATFPSTSSSSSFSIPPHTAKVPAGGGRQTYPRKAHHQNHKAALANSKK